MAKSTSPRLKGTPLERVLAASDRSGECWLWTRRINRDGYPEVKIGSRNLMAHRVAYEQVVGPIPAGLQLDHLCRVRHCVNPAHLEPVTGAENLRRSPLANQHKTHCRNGHPYSEANTYVHKGHRSCRTCNAAAARRYKQRNIGGQR